MRKFFVMLLFVSILVQPISAFASSLGFDTRYKMNLTSSSRDSEVYIPYQPVFLYPQTVSDEVFVAEADVELAQETDEANYSLIEGLSLNGQRIVESLFFRTGTVEINSFYLKPLNASPDIMTAEKLKLYDGSYLKIDIKDFSRGVVLSRLFSTSENGLPNNLDILEMNKGGHGYEVAYVKGAGMTEYEFVIIPKASKPGNIELLLNDTVLVVVGASSEEDVQPLKFSSSVDVKFSSLDEEPTYEYNGNDGTMVVQPQENNNPVIPSQETGTAEGQTGTETEIPTGWDGGVGGMEDISTGNEISDSGSAGVPAEYARLLKPGGAEKYLGFIEQGSTPSKAMEVLAGMGLVMTEEEAAEAAANSQSSGAQQPDPNQTDADRFFEEAGMTNKLDELESLQDGSAGVMQSPEVQKPAGFGTLTKPAKKELDTSKIDLDPMTWGVSIRDGSSYGTVTTDGDQLLAEWSDEMEINITSLTGKAHEFVQRKAVRPKPIVPILPTEIEVHSASPMLSMVMLAVGGGIVFLYVITMNSYVLKVRRRIKMAEIESLKSSGGTVIGDLESFEIS